MELCSETFTEETACGPPEQETVKSPVIAALGPFPDEVILSYVDRLWYFFSSGGFQNILGRSTTCSGGDSAKCACAECGTVPCPEEHRHFCHCSTVVSETSGGDPSNRTVSIAEKCTCPICRKTITHAKVYNKKPCCPCTSNSPCCSPVPEIRVCEPCCRDDSRGSTPRKAFQPLKRSFSLCSLACRKIKQKLTFHKTKGTQKWFWTRMHCGDDGAEIYEVFKHEITPHTNPTQIQKGNYPHIIFVVLSNGCIVPFETLTCH